MSLHVGLPFLAMSDARLCLFVYEGMECMHKYQGGEYEIYYPLNRIYIKAVGHMFSVLFFKPIYCQLETFLVQSENT